MHKISANSLFEANYLKVHDSGVIYMKTAAIGGKRTFLFSQIASVLMSETNVLSFQVDNEVFTVRVRPDKPAHQQAIAALLEGVQRSNRGFPGVAPGRTKS